MVDPTAELGKVSLCVYPVGSRPAQATPLFRYEVTGSTTGSGVSVKFGVEPAMVNGQLRTQEHGDLAMPRLGDDRPLTPDDIRDDVARRYQAVLAARIARDAGR